MVKGIVLGVIELNILGYFPGLSGWAQCKSKESLSGKQWSRRVRSREDDGSHGQKRGIWWHRIAGFTDEEAHMSQGKAGGLLKLEKAIKWILLLSLQRERSNWHFWFNPNKIHFGLLTSHLWLISTMLNFLKILWHLRLSFIYDCLIFFNPFGLKAPWERNMASSSTLDLHDYKVWYQ